MHAPGLLNSLRNQVGLSPEQQPDSCFEADPHIIRHVHFSCSAVRGSVIFVRDVVCDSVLLLGIPSFHALDIVESQGDLSSHCFAGIYPNWCVFITWCKMRPVESVTAAIER